MTREEYRRLPGNDKTLLNDSLNMVTEFMTGKKDDRDKYKYELLSNVEDFISKKTNENEVKRNLSHNAHAVGVCRTVIRRNFIQRKLHMYGRNTKFKSSISVDDSRSSFYLSNLMIAVHEANHADTSQYITTDGVRYYNGLMKISNNKSIGMAINESINELYTQIQFYNAFPEYYRNIKTVDDLIYGKNIPVFTKGIIPNGDIYRRVGFVTKLLLIACDNNLPISYTTLKGSDESFITKSVKLNNGEYAYKNDLIYAGKKNAKEFENSFNELCGIKNIYEDLLIKFDKLYKQMFNGNVDQKLIIDIIQIIDLYKNKKFDVMVEKGYWSTFRRNFSEAKYHNYKIFLTHLFDIHPASITEINIKPSVKKAKILSLNNKKTGND